MGILLRLVFLGIVAIVIVRVLQRTLGLDTRPRQEEPPLGAGESASVPGTAAVANALFDATGARFYAPPFTPDAVRQALRVAPPLQSA